MSLILLVVALLLSLMLLDVLAYIPLDILGSLHIPTWLFWGSVLLIFSWCVGESPEK